MEQLIARSGLEGASQDSRNRMAVCAQAPATHWLRSRRPSKAAAPFCFRSLSTCCPRSGWRW
eukprot:4056972-Lingulodinium_polyedra.AAC.1